MRVSFACTPRTIHNHDLRFTIHDSRLPMTDLFDLVRGCTFDDFLFSPRYSVLERRDPAAIDLSSRLSQRLTLKRPLVSAIMDTVTRAEMAIAIAEEGGIGIIDRGFRSGDIEPQVREVEKVKRRQHGVIVNPYTIGPGATLRNAAERCAAPASVRWWSSMAMQQCWDC